jgi:hypothetical protein
LPELNRPLFGDDDGTLRLKVKPREGMVYVDDYYAGRVDDFDRVSSGCTSMRGRNHIEIRADGCEPLDFDIDVQRNHAITYSGELERIQ